ncbi:MAG: FecR domain-containing protein, partial [Bacteroidota bacterium]
TALTEQTILFADSSITKVLRAVSAIYDVKLESNLSADEDQLFTGGIPVDNLDITLEMLKEIYQLNIEKIEEKYILEKE